MTSERQVPMLLRAMAASRGGRRQESLKRAGQRLDPSGQAPVRGGKMTAFARMRWRAWRTSKTLVAPFRTTRAPGCEQDPSFSTVSTLPHTEAKGNRTKFHTLSHGLLEADTTSEWINQLQRLNCWSFEVYLPERGGPCDRSRNDDTKCRHPGPDGANHGRYVRVHLNGHDLQVLLTLARYALHVSG
jgi:hypothetical protein